MSLVRVKALGWTLGEKLTAAQMTAVDANIENALDKRSGQTDTLSSVVSCASAGRIVRTFAAGTDADHTYAVGAANAIIEVSTLTADRIYTLSNTGAVAGDVITVLNRHATYAVTVKAATGPTTLVVLGPTSYNAQSTWAELYFDGSTWRLGKSRVPPKLDASSSSFVFTSNGTFVAPPGCYSVLLIGWGGGGQGGGGCGGCIEADMRYSGGAGGGASEKGAVIVAVTPGSSYSVTIGAGGTGGGAGGVGASGTTPNGGTAGGDGADTTFGSIAAFPGAGGGAGGEATSGAEDVVWVWGGGPVSLAGQLAYKATGGVAPDFTFGRPSFGGFGRTTESGLSILTLSQCDGAENPTSMLTGLSGGARGAVGTDEGDRFGGGGGGGGAAGVTAAGGAGGAGGNGDEGGGDANGDPGAAGTAGAANSGAGGGGGGGGGGGLLLGGTGGAGGAGGSGKLIVIPIYG